MALSRTPVRHSMPGLILGFPGFTDGTAVAEDQITNVVFNTEALIAYCEFQMCFNVVVCPFKESLHLNWALAGLHLRSSQASSVCVSKRRRWAGSVIVWQLCAWHPDNTPCDLLPHMLIHMHTQLKEGRVRGHERVRQTRTTRKRSWKKELVDNKRQKREQEIDLPFVFLFRDISCFLCLSLCVLLFCLKLFF